jgi:hypothetical protein
MNYIEDPISCLAECVAHAQYVGFSDIQYETRDWQVWRDTNGKEVRQILATRRPTTRDFVVHSMFTQTWGSTSLGHGGMGGAAVTTAYTVVLECHHTSEMLVYFGSQFCYKVNSRGANFALFVEDCRNHNLASKRESEKYQ